MTERWVFYPEGSIKSVLVFHWSQSLRFLVWMWFSLVNPLIDSTTLRYNSRQFQSWYRSLSEATSYIQTAEVSQSWFEGQVLRDPFAIPWRFHRKNIITMFLAADFPWFPGFPDPLKVIMNNNYLLDYLRQSGSSPAGVKTSGFLAYSAMVKAKHVNPFCSKHAPIIQALKTLAMPT